MVPDSPIDHFRHYGIFTGVGRHSHSGFGGGWVCLVPAIGVLHVRGFSASITNFSFAFGRLVAAAFFRHQSGLDPLFSTMPTNDGCLRYPSVGQFLMHFLDWCITGCFLWFYPLSSTPLLYAAACIHGSAVVRYEALFCFMTHVVAHAPSQCIGHEIWFFVLAILIEGLMRCVVLAGFLTTVGCFLICLFFPFVRARIMGMHTGTGCKVGECRKIIWRGKFQRVFALRHC